MLPRNSLPRIKLPNFSGEYKSWRSFYDLFTRMIRNNKDLSDAEKMHYLKTCVTGEAARLISNVPASSENFIVAWDLLISTYENKPFLISAQLDRIYDIKPLKVKSAQGMRSLRTTVLETVGALRALGCAVDQWDPLLVHYLVKLFDPQSCEIWEMKFGSSARTQNSFFMTTTSAGQRSHSQASITSNSGYKLPNLLFSN